MALRLSDKEKTLEQLEGDKWGKPTFHSSLVLRCHALRQKPIGQFSASDLRIMIGQKFSLNWLMPLALEVLRDDPWMETDFYPGDLLQHCLKATSATGDFNDELRVVCYKAIETLETFDDAVDSDTMKLACDFVRAKY